MASLAAHESGPDDLITLITAAPSTQSPPAIFSLPDELLVEIAAAGQVHEFDAEWALSHISHRFRDAIIGAPTLWTVVYTQLLVEGSVEISKLYLERSRACKIWVTLYEVPLGVDVERHSIVDRLSHLVPHIHRIRNLRIAGHRLVDAMLTPFREEI
ncbi:hypothetical protein DFH07DRAFT_376609 [Mycena maculata]|uniref:F-box domain-containing protein n=1 Tax=Mycena maculata TaxID=230809 RepID=A0AAD7NJH7_9AGAR|nr:hypothetical protein DFH07DRAFT_376609 [Mycena maculata]